MNLNTLHCRLIITLPNRKEFFVKNNFLAKALSLMLLCSMAHTFTMEGENSGSSNHRRHAKAKNGLFFGQPLPPAAVGTITLGALIGLGWMFKKAPQSELFVKTSYLCSMSPDALRISLGLGTTLLTISPFFSEKMAPGMKIVGVHALAAPILWGAANSRLLELGIRGIPGCSDADSKDIAPIATAAAFGLGNAGVRYVSKEFGLYDYAEKVTT